jgi:hypothetical protein
VINGTVLPKEKGLRMSPDSSPEVPNPQRAKIDVIDVASPPLSQMGRVVDKLSEKSKSIKEQTVRRRAFNKKVEDVCTVRANKTLDRGDELRARTMRILGGDWDPKKIIGAEPVRASKTLDRGEELKEYARRSLGDDWNKEADDVMTSAYSQSLRDNANLLVVTKDARSIKPSGQQISGDKHESATRGLNMSSSSSQQASQ